MVRITLPCPKKSEPRVQFEVQATSATSPWYLELVLRRSNIGSLRNAIGTMWPMYRQLPNWSSLLIETFFFSEIAINEWLGS